MRVVAVGAGFFSPFHQLGWQRIDAAECVAIVDQRPVEGARAGRSPRRGEGLCRPRRRARRRAAGSRRPRHAAGHPSRPRRPHAAPRPGDDLPEALRPDYAEAVALAESAERAGVDLVVHENFRWQPWYREARRLIDAGKLGALHSVAFRLRPGDGQGPRAYLDRQPYFQTMPRLLVRETAIHWIDTFRFLMGEIVSVYAHLRRINPVIAGEDAGLVVFEFGGGATGLFDGNRLNDHVAADPRRTMGEMWLEGSAGVLRLDGDARLWWKPHHARRSRTCLRPRACRDLRRRRLRGTAAPRRAPPPRGSAAREHGPRLPGEPARAGGRVLLGGHAPARRARCLRSPAGGGRRSRCSFRLTQNHLEETTMNRTMFMKTLTAAAVAATAGRGRPGRRPDDAQVQPHRPAGRRAPEGRRASSRRRSSSTRKAATRCRSIPPGSWPTTRRRSSSCSSAASTSPYRAPAPTRPTCRRSTCRCCPTWSRTTSRAGSCTTSPSGCRRNSPRRRPRAFASSPPGRPAFAT